MSKSNVIGNRSEILFIYDVQDGNPNGDPLDENKPRIDEESGLNIVTDVRLKRTIRDYLYNFKEYNGENGKDIFVREKASNNGKGLQDAKERVLDFGKDKEKARTQILDSCVDIRLFGGVLPMEKDSITLTGPVQFKIGRSLHKVELKHIKGTGAFASKAGLKNKTFREEYVLPYSLISFYGIINENAAKHTLLSEEDIDLLQMGLWEGTRNLLSRSKMLHSPRLMIRVEYKEKGFFIGELDKALSLKKKEINNKPVIDEEIRGLNHFSLDCSLLHELFEQNKKKINKIVIKKDPNLELINGDFSGLENIIETL